MRNLPWPAAPIVSILLFAPAAAPQTAAFTTQVVASGLDRPLFVTAPPGDPLRVFILEQTGRIRILKQGALLAAPFLDVSGLITAPPLGGNEQGLLGLAFHPKYQTNGYFYINYTEKTAGATVVARYRASANPDLADPAGAAVLLQVAQPFGNHNGGMLAFGPKDGYLYVGFGDGGSAFDPSGNGQNPGVLLGKLLRLDVDGGFPYAIPPTNPFVGPGNPLDEIWATGLRNPWRFAFDRLTGDLWIADVGQREREEIDFQPAASLGGQNYGWRCMEGTLCTGLAGCACNGPGLTLPIFEYSHADGCSITGGYVYRGAAIAGLQGTYFFADYCTNRIWSFRYAGNTVTELADRTTQLNPSSGHCLRSITSFGEDAQGELYLANRDDGQVFKLVPGQGGAAMTPSGPPAIGAQSQIRLASLGDGGKAYVSPFSLGTSPGLFFPDQRQIFLKPDLLFTLSLQPGAVMTGTIGILDAAGGATVGLSLPTEPTLVGLQLYTAFFVLEPAAALSIGRICCPLRLKIQ